MRVDHANMRLPYDGTQDADTFAGYYTFSWGTERIEKNSSSVTNKNEFPWHYSTPTQSLRCLPTI